MNCHECNDQLLSLTEGLLDEAAAQSVQDHLTGCPTCRAEHEATRQLRDRLLAAGDTPIGASLDQAVMDRILIQQVELTRRLKMKKRFQLYAAGALAATLLVSLTWAALYYGPTQATAAEVLARGVEAASNLKSIYIKCRMRTLPGDNFELLDLKHDFVDVELWKQFGPPLKWRIEKPGRVATMNGRETVMLIGNRIGVKVDAAAPSAFDTDWLHRLAAIDNVLSRELAATSVPSRHAKITRVDSPNDPSRQTVVVEVKANDNVGAYLKNKFLDMSDTRREYTFDRKTGRLETAKMYCRVDGKDVLALEIVEIKYNPAIADSQFEPKVPDGVVWSQQPNRLPDNGKYETMTPVETTRAFFDACSKRDWNEAGKFFSPLTDHLKQYLGGLVVVKLGEPFQAWPYPGWYVPYEIRLANGDVRKFNLAVRNDNPAKRYVVDGGL